MIQRFLTGAATLAVIATLAGCAGSGAQDPNPACRSKWDTVVNLVRCEFGIQPPPELPARTRESIDPAPDRGT